LRLAGEFALFSSLNEYPREKSFDEVVALIEAGDEDIESIQHLDSLDADELIDHLKNTRQMALMHFGPAADIAVEVSMLKVPVWGDDLGSEIYRELIGRLIQTAGKLVAEQPPEKKSERAEASAQHSSPGVSP
jgi:hypothetical protein